MLKTPIARGVALATLGATLAIPSMAQAAFIEDTKAGLELRNFYMNRDFRGNPDTANSKAEEWAQGFLLNIESGYTEGPIGFGVDALGLLGVKLDSGGGRTGTVLLPTGDSGKAADDYSELGLTAKAKVSETVLKLGTLRPKNMAVSASDSRLLPQTFQGGQITSKEISGLTLDAGYLSRSNDRNASGNRGMYWGGKGQAAGEDVLVTGEADDFVFAGGSYKLTNDLTASYYYSNLEEVYKQHSTNLVHILPLGDKQSLKTDLRYAKSSEDGSSNVDNRALGAMVTYSVSGHGFGLGYQKMSGDSGFAYLGGGADPFLVNYVQINDFGLAEMKSWQARYDFNFASVGIPGLTFMTRYITGDNYDRGVGQSEGKLWERDTDIAYTFQEGPLKNLNVKWRNATSRGNVTANSGNNLDENRLIVSYTIPLM